MCIFFKNLDSKLRKKFNNEFVYLHQNSITNLYTFISIQSWKLKRYMCTLRIKYWKQCVYDLDLIIL